MCGVRKFEPRSYLVRLELGNFGVEVWAAEPLRLTVSLEDLSGGLLRHTPLAKREPRSCLVRLELCNFGAQFIPGAE